MNALNIARLTFLEARQRKLFWIILVIGLLFLSLFALGFYFIHREAAEALGHGVASLLDFNSGFLVIGLYGVNSLGVLLAILVSVDTIAGEITSGTVQTIVTKPLRRWEIVVGKWMGLSAMMALFLIFMSAGILVAVYAIAGYYPPNLVQGVGLMVLESIVFLTLSILGGTRLPTLGNGVVVFMLYGVSFIAGWVEQVGSFLKNSTAMTIGTVIRLAIPGEAMWQQASYLMQPAVLRSLPLNPLTPASAPNPAMVFYTLGYIVVLVALAAFSFGRRDL